MELFRPDIFSPSLPAFSATAAATVEVVRRVAGACFSGSLPAIESVAQFGGNEINSNNFRLRTAAGEFLLKRLPQAADATVLGRQLALSMWLRESRSIAVPRVLPADNASGLMSNEGAHWCLFEFVPGTFFRGERGELASTAVEIGRMQRALGDLPQELAPPAKWAYNTAADAEVLLAAEQGKSQWPEWFGAASSRLLSDNWDRIARAASEQSDDATRWQAAAVGACHCDLHPHNILVDDGELRAFIDFESFVRMPVSASLGFAAFKLIRQHAVVSGIAGGRYERIASATRLFVDGLHQGSGSAIDVDELRFMATAEVLRRILVILRLNLRDRNAAWNHVLPMHLAGLQEIDLIFA